MSYRVIDPGKIKDVRGKRTLDEIVENSEFAFDRTSLSAWENRHWKPSEKNIIALLKGLGCNFDEISTPIEEITSQKNFK